MDPENGNDAAATATAEEASSTHDQQEAVAEGSTTEWLAKYEKAVAESIAERKKRQAAEARVAEYEKAAMTEGERVKAEAAEARAQAENARAELRQTRVEYAVRAKAAEMGVVDPEAAFRLLDLGTFDPDDPTLLAKQVEAALADLVGRKPYLKGATNATSPANGPTRAAKGLTADDLRRMSQDEVAAAWRERPEEVMAALRNQ